MKSTIATAAFFNGRLNENRLRMRIIYGRLLSISTATRCIMALSIIREIIPGLRTIPASVRNQRNFMEQFWNGLAVQAILRRYIMILSIMPNWKPGWRWRMPFNDFTKMSPC